MAAASPFPETFTDCPHCRCLCVGPTILPCGHVLCRRCLRQLLEQQGPDPTCSSCGHSIHRAQGQTVTEQLDQFCRDVVLQEVVADRIFRRCDRSCETCCTPAWTNVCLDCGTFHCIRCSENHRTEHAADCHAVVDPRKVLISASASATRPRPPGHEDVSQASTSLLEFQRQEVKRLEEKHSDHGRVQTDLDEVIAKLQTGRDRVRKQEHLLHMYTTRMPTTINTMSMRERLRRLREEISLPTSELLQDVRCGADRLVALWDVSAHKTHAEKNNSSTDCDAETVPPEYRLNIDMQNVRDVIVSQDQVEVHVWKKRKLNSCGGHVGSISSKRSTERVMITPKSTTISLDFGPVCVGHIADDVIQRTVKNVVIAKFDWAKELGRVQELKREKQRLMRQLQEEKVRGQQQLEAEKVRGQQQVAMEKNATLVRLGKTVRGLAAQTVKTPRHVTRPQGDAYVQQAGGLKNDARNTVTTELTGRTVRSSAASAVPIPVIPCLAPALVCRDGDRAFVSTVRACVERERVLTLNRDGRWF
ncbi:hypothetical protein BaRGS_00008849 [Batillaria attramentaria]|uniref:RING-type domain-containing protein n=1 Tax=Batillaria attramentaria TaxID=370345 RepID=A0ABD0LL88_9CAEN